MITIPLVAGWISAGFRLAVWALVCWLIVTGLDYLNNDPFSADKDRLNDSAIAIAVYRGLRWFAVLIGAAIILG